MGEVGCWSVDQSIDLGPKGTESKFVDKGTQLLDIETFTSVKQAVEFLQAHADSHADGCYVVFSANRGLYYLIFRKGRQQQAFEALGIGVPWSIECASLLCNLGEESTFQGKAMLLDPNSIDSVRDAVSCLNFPHDTELQIACPDGFCVVLSSSRQQYFLLYEAGKKDKAFDIFKLQEASVQPRLRRQQSRLATLACMVQDFVSRSLAGFGLDTESKGPGSLEKLLRAGEFNCPFTERYEVVRQIGSGRQGTTSLVRRRLHSEPAAPEAQLFVAKEAHDMTAAGVEDFKREFEKMRALRHPNCLKVIELVQHTPPRGGNPQLYIISEYAQGGDLYGYLKSKTEAQLTLQEADLANIFQQAFRGLAYLHTEGFVHNDVKPENLLVMNAFQPGEAPCVVLADYGCAMHDDDTHRIFGDPRYQAPESVRAMMDFLKDSSISPPKMQPAVDVWSTGVTLFEVLSGGRIPFLYQPCPSDKLQQVFYKLTDAVMDMTTSVDVSSYCDGVSEECEDILKQLLEKDQEKRPSVSLVLDHPWLQGPGVQQAPPTLSLGARRFVDFCATRNRVRQILRQAVASKLKYEHLQKCERVFRKYDPDHSGTLDRDEFLKAYCELRPMALSRAEADRARLSMDGRRDCSRIFTSADMDGSGSLEFNEFAAMTLDWSRLDGRVLDEHLADFLHTALGANGTQVEVKAFQTLFDGVLDPQEVANALTQIDVDGDGFVTVEELKNFVVGSQLAAPHGRCDS